MLSFVLVTLLTALSSCSQEGYEGKVKGFTMDMHYVWPCRVGEKKMVMRLTFVEYDELFTFFKIWTWASLSTYLGEKLLNLCPK